MLFRRAHFFALVFVILGCQFTYAQNISFAPTYPNPDFPHEIIFDAKPGSTHQQSISITNISNENIDLFITAVDLAKGPTGHSALLANGANHQKFGAWTKISTPNISLRPQEYIEIPYQVSIPEHLKSGVYTGGITISEQDQSTQNSNTIAVRHSILNKVVVKNESDFFPAIYLAIIFTASAINLTSKKLKNR